MTAFSYFMLLRSFLFFTQLRSVTAFNTVALFYTRTPSANDYQRKRVGRAVKTRTFDSQLY